MIRRSKGTNCAEFKRGPTEGSINGRYNFIVITEKLVGKKRLRNFFFLSNNYFIKFYQICIFFSPSHMQAPSWEGSRPSRAGATALKPSMPLADIDWHFCRPCAPGRPEAQKVPFPLGWSSDPQHLECMMALFQDKMAWGKKSPVRLHHCYSLRSKFLLVSS